VCVHGVLLLLVVVVVVVVAQTFEYSILDAVPPIHGESYHVATDKDPSMPPSWRQVPVYF